MKNLRNLTIINAILDNPVWYRTFCDRVDLTDQFVTSELRNLCRLWEQQPVLRSKSSGGRLRLSVSCRVARVLMEWSGSLEESGYTYYEGMSDDGRHAHGALDSPNDRATYILGWSASDAAFGELYWTCDEHGWRFCDSDSESALSPPVFVTPGTAVEGGEG